MLYNITIAVAFDAKVPCFRMPAHEKYFTANYERITYHYLLRHDDRVHGLVYGSKDIPDAANVAISFLAVYILLHKNGSARVKHFASGHWLDNDLSGHRDHDFGVTDQLCHHCQLALDVARFLCTHFLREFHFFCMCRQ